MASTERGRLLTEAHRHAQYAVRAASLRETIAVAATLDPRRLDETFPAYRRRMRAVILKGRALSAATSAAYYRAFREAEGATSPLDRIPLAEALPAAVDTSLLVTGPIAAKQAAARGIVGDAAAQVALSATLGSTGRHVLNGGRDTLMGALRADPDALGVARVTDGQPCAFCAMLAGRGAVYSKETASFHPHDRCGCQPEPMFERGAIPESSKPYADLWKETSKGKSGAAARKAFADAHNARSAVDAAPKTLTRTDLPAVTKREILRAEKDVADYAKTVVERKAEIADFRRMEREGIAANDARRAKIGKANADHFEGLLSSYEAALAEKRALLERLKASPIREELWTRLPRIEANPAAPGLKKMRLRQIEKAEKSLADLNAGHPEWASTPPSTWIREPGGREYLLERSRLQSEVSRHRTALAREADPSSLEESARLANPNYGQDDLYGVNCVHVAQTYELRRRGFDVTASKLPERFRGNRGRNAQEALDGWTTPDGSTRAFDKRTPLQIEKDVQAWPEGARGWVVVQWETGGAHIYNVERTAEGSRFVEAQTLDPDASGHLARSKHSFLVRVDDLEPTDSVLEYVAETPKP